MGVAIAPPRHVTLWSARSTHVVGPAAERPTMLRGASASALSTSSGVRPPQALSAPTSAADQIIQRITFTASYYNRATPAMEAEEILRRVHADTAESSIYTRGPATGTGSALSCLGSLRKSWRKCAVVYLLVSVALFAEVVDDEASNDWGT